MTREDYVDIGAQFSAGNVIAAVQDALALARRDQARLTVFGWTPSRTLLLEAAGDELEDRVAGYEAKNGQHIARNLVLALDIDAAKRWRLRVVSLLQLTAPEAEPEYRAHVLRVGRDPEKLGTQIAALLTVARKYEPQLRESSGADDAFFAEGGRLVEALRAGASARRMRPKDLPAERDSVDELCGRVWEQLKALTFAGRSLHKADGSRALAAQYTLDVLYGRNARRARKPLEAPAAPAA